MNKDEKETYLGGVESYDRSVPVWLIIVYASLTVWGIYYLIKYWGGWGPGL
jgi:hypothetical protein